MERALRSAFHPLTSRWLEAYAPWRLRRNQQAEVFLLWFPKTGGTWVRLLLHEAICRHYAIEGAPPLELEPLKDFDPRVPRIRPLHDDAPHWKRPEQLRPHKERYRGKKVLLLVRDPRDVMVSLHLQVTRRWKVQSSTSLSDFIWQQRGGLETFIRWYNLWAEHRDTPAELMLLRYEDLHDRPEGSLRDLLNFVGIPDVSDEVVRDSCAFNRIDALRQREASGTYSSRRLRPGNMADPESFKARKGKVGGYVDYMAPDDAARITAMMHERLDPWFGYSNTAEPSDAHDP